MAPIIHNPASIHQGGIEYRPDVSLDGVALIPGQMFHCRARMVHPATRVRVVRQVRTTASWLDGRHVWLWEVQPIDGGGAFIVEPWLLSSMPVGEVLGLLKSQVATRQALDRDAPASSQ
ncbi:MAG: hypothetical protein RIE32_06500 [Phycisphaerales bacterium]